ncbi:Protein CBG02308 [Caenorhabditis briggsae]|uniref:Protein CBG02308 n=1 Tax=Caenorhabditis briggsae TaxID=6238 RepID=A8WUM5_CAEBR|nr:Protein CBG02308 [Caenorhabditis briggsae]CAP24187.2 Protein CBG02308 [Caenorhabditis briggsae]
MPSSFIRKHVRGLLRNKFGPSTSLDNENQKRRWSVTETNDNIVVKSVAELAFEEENAVVEEQKLVTRREHLKEDEPTTPRGDDNSELQNFLGGIDLRRHEFPEVYFGKTGLDLPAIQLEALDGDVFGSYTGPEGGLTEVGEVRQGVQMVRMANIDDEMSLSIDGTTDEEAEDEEDLDAPISMNLKKSSRHSLLLGSCSSILGPNGEHHDFSAGRPSAEDYDWSAYHEQGAYGMSVSLYEKNPITGVNAGEPIADVWGVVGRSNNGVLALADGVNWGEGARLAARCAIRGAIDHLNARVIKDSLSDTTEVFHEMLAAFHSAHSLILQEGGMLTTLCVALVAPVKRGNGWALCVCNVGDSLCFVYNRHYGVREVTLGSHDIDQMRDMRDAGGALGPVDGRNPQLHNLTCSMTFVEEGDVVFITSDGVSDNFDPVVGKFCVIKKIEQENKENALRPREDRTLDVSTRGGDKNSEYARNRPCAASLPCVDAAKRHELMLVRMRDVIANGFGNETPRGPESEYLYPPVTASTLCHRLIHFATQLSMAKRRVLENPELYKRDKMTKAEQRARRKMVRERIADMPGKLDHASVVAYHVSRRGLNNEPSTPPGGLQQSETEKIQLVSTTSISSSEAMDTEPTVALKLESSTFARVASAQCVEYLMGESRSTDPTEATIQELLPPSPMKSKPEQLILHGLVDKPVKEKNNNTPIVTNGIENRPVSPYEQLPISSREAGKRRKKHGRGSIGRHTLGVDVQWLKKLVTKKEEQKTADDIRGDVSLSSASTDRTTLRQRIRSMLGSNRNLANSDQSTVKISMKATNV